MAQLIRLDTYCPPRLHKLRTTVEALNRSFALREPYSWEDAANSMARAMHEAGFEDWLSVKDTPWHLTGGDLTDVPVDFQNFTIGLGPQHDAWLTLIRWPTTYRALVCLGTEQLPVFVHGLSVAALQKADWKLSPQNDLLLVWGGARRRAKA